MSLKQRLQQLIPTKQTVPVAPKQEKVVCQGDWINGTCKSTPTVQCVDCKKHLCEDCRFLDIDTMQYRCYWCEFDLPE